MERRSIQMRGEELVAWRRRNGFTQAQLMAELDVRSRQTMSAWEKPDREVPRLVELALMTLEREPSVRLIHGKKATPSQMKTFENARAS
jgi:transcriptional regulator with XRE-family HTH domain